jgi:quercetin dioxygenase-like cupin family protein
MTDSNRRRRRVGQGFRWEAVDVHPYKPEPGSGGPLPFRHLSRQILFDGPDLACQVRFFDIEPSGHSSLERHGHAHAVVVLGGRGRCLVGTELIDLEPGDLIEVRPWEWHQFRARDDDHLGFVCIVNRDRDRPQLPTAAELDALRRDPAVAAFLDPPSA